MGIGSQRAVELGVLMNRYRLFVLFILALATSYAWAWNQINPYLRGPANTHEALMRAIKTDPIVMDRYMRHFTMTREEVILYFSTLRWARLERGGPHMVYNVPASTGQLRVRTLNLPQGEPVWVDRWGNPVLQVVCGNPMTRGPKRPETPNKVTGRTTTIVEEELKEIPNEVGASREVVAAVPPIEPELPIIAAVPEVNVIEMPSTYGPDVITEVVRRGGGGFSWLALPGAAAIFFIGGDGGGGGGGGVPPGDPPVPEPATMAALLTGAGFYLARRRRRAQS